MTGSSPAAAGDAIARPPLRATAVHATFVTFGEALLRAANFAIAIYIARAFSPSILGIYANAIAIATITVTLADGNILSFIQSNFQEFGSGITVPGFGFILQDRGAMFSLDPASPNALAGHKRPLHTIIPAFMERGDEHIGFGIMGGWKQPLAHAQFVSNIADCHMNI